MTVYEQAWLGPEDRKIWHKVCCLEEDYDCEISKFTDDPELQRIHMLGTIPEDDQQECRILLHQLLHRKRDRYETLWSEPESIMPDVYWNINEHPSKAVLRQDIRPWPSLDLMKRVLETEVKLGFGDSTNIIHISGTTGDILLSIQNFYYADAVDSSYLIFNGIQKIEPHHY